jgi:hypothetical protein
VSRPRAADDFGAIRARMEELRRERAEVSAEPQSGPPHGPRPYAVGTRSAPAEKPRTLSAILRALTRTSTD